MRNSPFIKGRCRGLLLVSLLASAPALAAPASSKVEVVSAKVIAGWLERVTLTATGQVVKAKLDTGAKTSSIHATNIKAFKRDGTSWVRFDLPIRGSGDAKWLTIERPRIRKVRIKDHDDPSSRRPLVELEICLDGRRHNVEFTLANRSNFLYPILLGRRFLSRIAVVDPGVTYVTNPGCPAVAGSGK